MIKNSVTKNSSDIEIIDLFALKSLNSEELEKVAAVNNKFIFFF